MAQFIWKLNTASDKPFVCILTCRRSQKTNRADVDFLIIWRGRAVLMAVLEETWVWMGTIHRLPFVGGRIVGGLKLFGEAGALFQRGVVFQGPVICRGFISTLQSQDICWIFLFYLARCDSPRPASLRLVKRTVLHRLSQTCFFDFLLVSSSVFIFNVTCANSEHSVSVAGCTLPSLPLSCRADERILWLFKTSDSVALWLYRSSRLLFPVFNTSTRTHHPVFASILNKLAFCLQPEPTVVSTTDCTPAFFMPASRRSLVSN